MKIILSLLFIAAVAAATKSQEEEVKELYDQLMVRISEAENKYHKLPPSKEQFKFLDSHNILRFASHLKNRFSSLIDGALNDTCNNELHTCYGSDSYRKGAIESCLNSDEKVKNDVSMFKNFTACTDNFFSQIVYNIERVEEDIRSLVSARDVLNEEYKDEKNRYEMILVLKYHEQFILKNSDSLMNSVVQLQTLYKDLQNSLNICASTGFPRISADFFHVFSVKQCLEDSLFTDVDATLRHDVLNVSTEESSESSATTEGSVSSSTRRKHEKSTRRSSKNTEATTVPFEGFSV